MNPNVTISDDLKKMMAQCQPGESKTMSVKVSSGKDGSITVGPADMEEEAGEMEMKPPAKKSGGRPKPVMEAIRKMM